MQAGDGDSAEAVSVRRFQCRPRVRLIQRRENLAFRRHPLARLDDALMQKVRLHDVQSENIRPRLHADFKRVAEALGHHQDDVGALALQQRIGGDSCAEAYFGHGIEPCAVLLQDQPDCFKSGVLVAAGVHGEQFANGLHAIGRARDHVGERAAAVDPEAPSVSHWRGTMPPAARQASVKRLNALHLSRGRLGLTQTIGRTAA